MKFVGLVVHSSNCEQSFLSVLTWRVLNRSVPAYVTNTLFYISY